MSITVKVNLLKRKSLIKVGYVAVDSRLKVILRGETKTELSFKKVKEEQFPKDSTSQFIQAF